MTKPSQHPTITAILDACAEEFHISRGQLFTEQGMQSVRDAKRCAVWIFRNKLGKSLHEIADYLGLSDHSTVFHYGESLKMKKYAHVAKKAEAIAKRVLGGDDEGAKATKRATSANDAGLEAEVDRLTKSIRRLERRVDDLERDDDDLSVFSGGRGR